MIEPTTRRQDRLRQQLREDMPEEFWADLDREIEKTTVFKLAVFQDGCEDLARMIRQAFPKRRGQLPG